MKEFKEFLLKSNALALAVGVIIGGAVGKVVSSLVSDILMPPIGLLLGNIDFSNLFLNLSATHYATLDEARKAGAPTLNYGRFLNTVIEFAIVAFAVFLLVRQFNRLKRPAEVVTRDCPFCVSPISLKATRCPQCTSEIRTATA